MDNNKILNINYEKFTLGNGLEVILYPDNSLPLVAVNLWYKVGSSYETKGKTGIAHLFEHMMFQGSANVPKEKHFWYIQQAGGNLNGSTSLDRTNYYETLPANYLEMALWLESDRMGFLVPALTQEKLDNQRDVVMNERRQRYDNQPYGLAWEKLFSNLFPENHPYHWPTIGWMKDIEGYTLDDVSGFFNTYYAPNNASLVIGGDINIDEAKKLVEKYFGEIPSGKPIKPVKNGQLVLGETKKIIHEDNIQLSRLYMAWHSDVAFGPDDAKLDILSDILSGSKNSRLHKTLVHDKQIAQNVSSFQYSANVNGSFIIIATAAPGVDTDTLRDEILLEINKIIDKGVTDEEITRSQNSIKSTFIYSLQNIENMANQINHYNSKLGEPNSFIFDLGRYEKVTKKDITDCVSKYLTKNFIELHVVPKMENK